ncbi:MAG: hypothetical protein Q9175_007027 [Cornicularia normoerica]
MPNLRCNNVGGLEDRLSNIEAELSFMNTLFKTNGNQRLSIETATEDGCSGEIFAGDPLGEDGQCLPTDRHIVRSSLSLTDRYHGPSTLFALCNDFCDILLPVQRIQTLTSAKDESQRSEEHSRPAINDVVKDLLNHLCLEAGTEEAVDLQANSIPIRLPPKQFLLMAQTQFFEQADYATDIFVQSSFWPNVERVYSRPFTPADEAWAICYNTIILLVLGPESSSQDCDTLVGSQFVRPFLLTVRSALSNPRVLMAAKLVNVQALALMVSTPGILKMKAFAATVTNTSPKSIAAQMYYPLGFAESIFAQPCVLARTMGLNQARSAPEGVSPEEAQEHLKVFTSLYLRDKSFSILRGSICWLPSFDCSISSELGDSGRADPRFAVRIELARLQDESYRLFQSADISRRSSAKYKSALLHVEQGLEHWANANKLFSSPYASSREVDLQLEFLAVRICVFRQSPEPSQVRRALSDSRASCLLVVISHGKHEPSMIERLDDLLLSKSPSKSSGRGTSGRSSESNEAFSSELTEQNTSESVPPRLCSLLDSFSVPAFFLLATNVIWPSSASDESKAEEDLKLLQRTCACYKELDAKTQANNHTRKVGRAFESLLEVISLIKTSQQVQPSHSGMQQSNNAHNTPGTNNPFGEQHRRSESSNLPSPSATSIPPISWESFLNKNTFTTTRASPSAGASHGSLTPMDAQDQPYKPHRQNLSYPHMQQQIMQPPSSNHQQTSESDVFMDDYADSKLLSEFLATNSSIPF